jgi:predicted acyltransferase
MVADQQEPLDELAVLFTGGLAAACLAVCYWLCDTRESALTNKVTEPFVALGRNAILLVVGPAGEDAIAEMA